MKQHYDVVIVGGGVVGATAALLLAKNTPLNIAILEAKMPVFSAAQYEDRVSALSPASKNILQSIDIWAALATQRQCAYERMHVWDATGKAEIHFDCHELQEPALGYIVEDALLREQLLKKILSEAQIDWICPVTLVAMQETPNQIEFTTDNQDIISAKLVIAADGAHSWVREQAKIELKIRDYQHTALVATVCTEFPHENVARQRFLVSGPLAFLPLQNPHRCSIVWSTSHEQAAKLAALSDEEFAKELAEAFELKLGKIHSVHQRGHYPLYFRHAKHYVQSRLALVGDAAHTIHPMAGQGVNLGLLDAATLVEIIRDAYEKKRSFSSFATLRRYERWRKTDTLAMLTFIDALKYLFASEQQWLIALRNHGMNLTNRVTWIKHFFAHYALGKKTETQSFSL